MNRLISLGIVLFFVSCNSQPKTTQTKSEPLIVKTAVITNCTGTSKSCAGCPEAAAEGKALIVAVDSVQKHPEKYFDKTIALQGRVVHTCKVSGKKMFLAGSDDQNLIRINAGEKISRFDETLQGEIVIAKGVLTPITEVANDKEKDGKTACVTEAKTKKYLLECSEFEIATKNQ